MRDNDFRLLTLGRLALLGPAGDEVPELNTRRRKVALLAVLALSGPGGTPRPVSRDSLLEMFWGDQDDVRARHSLSDAISHLRRVMGRDAIVTTRAEAALAPEVRLEVDAREFEQAVVRRDFARAVSLYAGPFLEGVHVGGSNRFEQWLARERTRLEALFLQSCSHECTALARARRWEACAALAGRWLDAAPLSADAALFLLNAIKSPGTREADRRALAAFAMLRERLTREYDLAPDAAVIELAEGIRERLGSQPGLPAAPADLTPVPRSPIVRDVEPSTLPEPRDASGWRDWVGGHRQALAGVAVLAAIALFIVAPAMWSSDERPRPAPTMVAVLPFTVHGGPELEYLTSGMVSLLSTNLDGAAGFRTVDPRAVLAMAGADPDAAPVPTRQRAIAARLGAGSYVAGNVVQAGGRVRIDAALYDGGQGGRPVARASAEGSADDVFAMVDHLTAELLADRAPEAGGRLTKIAAMTTHSIPALKAYLEGENHWRAVRLPEAIESFERAVTLDSTFALAWYRLGVASSWEARVDLARDALERARRYSATLSEHDQRLVAAYHAVTQRKGEEVELRYRSIIADYPADLEAWAGLGEMWFHGNPIRGRSFTESRQAWEHILRLEPRNMGAAWHLSQVAARERRYAELDSLITRISATASGGAALSLQAIRATTLGTPAEQDALVPELREADDYTLIITLWRIALFSSDLDAVARYARLLTDGQRPSNVRAVGHVLLAHLELARGRWRGAQAQLQSLEALHPAWAIEYRALLATSPFLPVDPAEAARLRDAVARWDGKPMRAVTSGAALWVNAHHDVHPQLKTYLQGLLNARLGDAEAARRQAAWLGSRQAGSEPGDLARVHARGILAEVARQAGNPAGALQVLEASPFFVDFGSGRVSAFFALARERYLRAELLHELGRDEEALGWYGGLGEIFPYDVIYVAPSHLRQAEIHERAGLRSEAAEHYERFIAMWEEADPELQPMLEEARRRLAALRSGG
jgi:DNA-binding SARP family transcriptional activator/TolB-like protein